MSFDVTSYIMGKQAGGGGGGSASLLTETTYAELKALRDGGNLVPGMLYRITDFVTTVNGTYDVSEMAGGTPTYVHYARSAGHPFDLIVTALDSSTLDERAIATQHEGDTYFANSHLEAWDVKYTLDNDPTKYMWANPTNGKGVITFLRDEFNNEARYDFKNVQILCYALKMADPEADPDPLCYGYEEQGGGQTTVHHQRYGSVFGVFQALAGYLQSGDYISPWTRHGVAKYDFYCGANILGTAQFPTVDATYLSTFNAGWYYTFDFSTDGSTHTDYSLNPSQVQCYENKIALCQDALASYTQQAVIPMGINASVWETDAADHLNAGNELGENSFLNIFGSACRFNRLDAISYGNILGSYCNSNTFWDNCYSNTFGNSCISNTFGNSCHSNTFGDSCYSNTFGNYCNSNTFGDSCDSNTFGNNCISNTFGSQDQNNELVGEMEDCRFGDGCQFVTIGWSAPNNARLFGLVVGQRVTGVTVPVAQLSEYGAFELVTYNPNSYSQSAGDATLIHRTGYNTETAVSTTDGGQTWTSV